MNHRTLLIGLGLALAAPIAGAQPAADAWQLRGEAGWIHVDATAAPQQQPPQQFGAPQSGYRWIAGSNAHWERVSTVSGADAAMAGAAAQPEVPAAALRDTRPLRDAYPHGQAITGG